MDHNYSALTGVPFCISSNCRPPSIQGLEGSVHLTQSCLNIKVNTQYEKETLQMLSEMAQAQSHMLKEVDKCRNKKKINSESSPHTHKREDQDCEHCAPEPNTSGSGTTGSDRDMQELGHLVEDMGLAKGTFNQRTTSQSASALSSPPTGIHRPSLSKGTEVPSYAMPALWSSTSLPSMLKHATIGLSPHWTPRAQEVVSGLPDWTSLPTQTPLRHYITPAPECNLYVDNVPGPISEEQVATQELLMEEERAKARATSNKREAREALAADTKPSAKVDGTQYQRFAAMGFSPDMVEIAMDYCREGESSVVEFLINMSSLVEAGISTATAGAALGYMANDVEKARAFGLASTQLQALGFERERVAQALLLFHNKVELAADYLMQQPDDQQAAK